VRHINHSKREVDVATRYRLRRSIRVWHRSRAELPPKTASYGGTAAHRAGTRAQRRRAARTSSMRPVMDAMVMVVVVPMMRRVRQRNICQKNQCDREPNNLTHDSIPNLSM
jgi:hypothetical protein